VLLTLAVLSVGPVRNFELSPLPVGEPGLDEHSAGAVARELHADAVRAPNPELGEELRP
jgi:hypothetical protein